MKDGDWRLKMKSIWILKVDVLKTPEYRDYKALLTMYLKQRSGLPLKEDFGGLTFTYK